MPGCPAGADPQPGLAGVQHLLEITGLETILHDLIARYSPTALTTYTASMIDVSELCTLNPDPPQPLTMLDFVQNLTYLGSPLASQNTIVQYIFKWLEYQEFTRVCVCRAIPVNPTLNCVHATNITVPPVLNGTVVLGTAQIEDAVYNTFTITGSNSQAIRFSTSKVNGAGTGSGIEWFVQYQHQSGTWIDFVRGDQIVNGSTTSNVLQLTGGSFPLPKIAPLRLRSDGAASRVLTNLDICFIPFDPVMEPIPPQPDLPGGPLVPPPVCSTDDLCAIVLELGRQLTRVSGQVADIQATVGGTDQLVILSSQPISGEGEATLAVGTRAVSIELIHLGPGVFTSALGRPRGLMRAGSIRWGDGEGYSKRQFIDAEDFTRLRPQGSLTVSWQLINECVGSLHFLG